MTMELQNELTAEFVVEGLQKLIALNQNNMDAALDQLKVPPEEKEQAKSKLSGLLSGDEALLAELRKDLSAPEIDGGILLVAVPKGGITKFKVLKKWGIPYGFRLYISHEIMSHAQDIGAMISAVIAACGPEAAPVAAGVALGLAALKLLDRGNGIMITQVPPVVGPCIPTPQL